MKSILFIATAVLLFGCADHDPAPANLLTKEQMTKILMEVHLTESVITTSYYQGDSGVLIYKAAEKKILANHGADSATFYDSYRWYARNIEDLDAIYAAIVDSLALREAIIRNE